MLRDNTAQTLMPAVVEKHQLERAIGRMWGVETVMNNFVGPPLAGVLLGLALALPFLANAGLLAVGAALVVALTGSFQRRAPDDRPDRLAGRDREGFRWLWRHPLLRAFALLLGGLNLLGALGTVVLVLFVQEVLGLYEGCGRLVITGMRIGGRARLAGGRPDLPAAL
ncbi:MAG: hypothetical protein R2719_12530 [Micropruina sp.]